MKKTKSKNSITKAFGNKVRVRVCGLLFNNEKLLLIKHKMDGYSLWAPPGGGIEFGESIEATLRREFQEETGITVKVNNFLFMTEHIAPPLHAVELFYHVSADDFSPRTGREPELEDRDIFLEIEFIGTEELRNIPPRERHTSLKSCTNPIELLDKRGQLK